MHFLTTLFHAKHLTMAKDPSRLVTLGVATEPYPAAGRSHDYVLCEGELWKTQADVVKRLDELYPQYFPSDPV